MPSGKVNPWVIAAAAVGGAVLAYFGGKAMIPRGIKNNNPGNIRYTGTKWKGLADPPSDEKGFCRFVDTFHGLRALCINALSIYQKGARSLLDFTTAWAPSSDGNEPEEYARFLATRTGTESPRVRFPFTDKAKLAGLAKAVTSFENGMNPYTNHYFEDAATEALTYKGYL